MAPDLGGGAAPGAPGGMPAPPPGPPPGTPAFGASPPGGAPAPAPGWNDPAAFAATAPPPTADEHEAAQRAKAPPSPEPAPPPPASPPAAPPASAAPSAHPPAEEARPSAPPPTGVSRTEAQVARDPMSVGPDAPRTLAGFLVSYEANELGTFWPLYQGKNVVGRKAAIEGLDIEIDHPTTSSRHAVLHAAARPGALKLEDPGSTNGTYLNEERVAKGTPVEIRDGDTLRFGGYTTTVKIV
ncbi:MAG: hypothetical protein AMXMBFR56_55100 [Polyangiaceae bacterium]